MSNCIRTHAGPRSPRAGGGSVCSGRMNLAPAPELPYVIGVPFALLLLCCVAGVMLWVLLGRVTR